MSGGAAADKDYFDLLEHRLSRIERLLAIGFGEQIQAKREIAGVDDQVVAAVLERTGTWSPAGPLKAKVEAATGQSAMTVKRPLKELVDLGALEKRGQTASTEYRSTGLFG
jgi:hypothetical protein